MAVIKTIGKLTPGAYKQMIDHLTRKKIKNPFIKAKDIVVDKKQSVEDMESVNRFVRDNPRQDMAGGGMLVQPSADGSRPGYDGRKNRKVSYDTENKIVREYNKYLTDEIKSGNLSKSLGFKSWLKKNKTPTVFEKTYNAHSKKLLDVKPSKLTDAKIGLVKAYVERANEQGQFVEKRRILELIGRTQTPGVAEKNVYVKSIIKEINKLDSREDKVHKALNRLFNNELVFVTDPDFYKKFPSDKEAGSITRMLIQETGLTGPTIRQHRATWKKGGSKVPFFSTKKGKEQLKIIEHMNLKMGKVGESTFNGFNFNNLLEYGANSKKGGMYYKKATGSDFYRDPNNVVRQFVVRHFDHNSKFGDKSKLIKVFKKGTNTEVKYEPGKRLVDFDFTYKGKRYGSNELAKEYLKWTRGESTPFKEVYDNHKLYTDFLRKPVNIGDPSVKNIGDLFRLAGHQGMAIEHGSLGGVAEEPFKNLKLLSSRANSEIGTILQYYKKFPKVQKLLVNEFIKELPVNENYIDALAKNEIKIAKDMLKNGNTTIPMTYNQAAKNILTNKNIKNFSPTELLTVSKSAFGPDIGYRSFVGVEPERFKNITTKKQLDNLLFKLSGQIDKDCAGAIKQASKDGGRIGLQSIGSRTACITKAKNYARDQILKGIPDTGVKGSLIKRIFKSTNDFVKSALDPKELFDIKKQFFSKGALASLPIFDAGIAAYEATAMNKPIKEAVSNTLIFGSIPRFMTGLPETPDVLQAKRLLNNPNLSPAGKEYAQLLIDLSDYKTMSANRQKTEDTDNFLRKQGISPDEDYKKIIDEEMTRLENKIKSSKSPDQAGKFDYENLVAEDEATRLAKDEYDPIFGSLGDPLKNRAVTPRSGTRGGRGPLKDLKIDLSPITYENFQPVLPLKEDVDDYLRGEGMIGQDQMLTDEAFQREFEQPAKFEQLMQLPSFRGASEKFAGGGIAKLAGVSSGPPPESGPNSQGLQGLMKRGMKI